MSSLDESFSKLREELKKVDRLDPTQSDPFFYFVHAAEDTQLLVRKLPSWCSTLEQKDGWKISIVSIADVMWKVIDASGRWDDWLEVEQGSSRREASDAVRDALDSKEDYNQRGLAKAILEHVSPSTPDRLLLLTDAALLHPFFRVHTIDTLVHDKARVPTVLFYPGSLVGKYGLRFLGFYPEDPNYHSTIIGGET